MANQFLIKESMAAMRGLSAAEITTLQAGTYEGVQLLGYYRKGDTPSPIIYYLASTNPDPGLDDNGSIIEVGSIKLVHKFRDNIKASYFGLQVPTTDIGDTLKCQRIIDLTLEGMVADFENLIIKVTKNPDLISTDNSQPCLEIKGKSNIKIVKDGGYFEVSTHGQGIFELINTNNVQLNGIVCKGSFVFPNLDGETGRGEKGTSDQGYHSTPFYGNHKNNSRDTSANTTGGFGHQFPREDGSTGSTWGTWRGGFIGNIAFGILVNHGNKNTMLNNCDCQGFNYVGIGIGFNGNFSPIDLATAYNENITLNDCTCMYNYSLGVHSMHVKKLNINGGNFSYNGHPDAEPSKDLFADPGYGYASVTSSKYTLGANIRGVIASNNVRKGLDSHAGEGINFLYNVVENNGVCGIYSSTSSAAQLTKQINIIGNKLYNNSFARGALGAIYVGGDAALSNLDVSTNVKDNFIDKWGAAAIRCRYVANVDVQSNVIKDSISENPEPIKYAAILIQGKNASVMSKHVTVSNNKIVDSMGVVSRGIQTDYVDLSTVFNNIIEYKSIVNIGIYASNCGYVDFLNNKVSLIASGGLCYSLAQTKGFCENNTAIGGDLGYMYPNLSNKTRMQVAKVISFDITFNGGTPVITKLLGSDHIGVVTITSSGMQVSLTGLGDSAYNIVPLLTVKSISGIKTNSLFLNNNKITGVSKTAVSLEFRETESLNSPRINPTTILNGTINITLILN